MLIDIFFLLLSLAIYAVYLKRRPKTFPPGPFSLPIIGNFLQLGREPYKNVMTLRRTYGDIIGIDLGPKRSIFINEYSLIKEAFNSLALCGRTPFRHFAVQETGEFRGIAITSGKVWVEQRRFAFSYLQSGLRNGVPIESLIVDEANELVKDLKDTCGQPISTAHLFNIPAINSLWNIIAGERYSSTDSNLLKIMQHIIEYTTCDASQGVLIFAFDIAKMFPKISGYQKFMDNLNPVLNFLQKIIDSHKGTYQDGIQTDFIDCYIKKIKDTTDENSSFFGKTGEESLLHALQDIFMGGSETVSTALKWLVFLMAHHLDVQEKLSNSISKVMPQKENPVIKDRQMLPYVEAVIMEVLRYSAFTPIGVIHEAIEDVQFRGFLIPKGTMIVANQFGVLHDPEVWGDPENFRPERFLDEDGTVINHPAFIPFSTGRRVCPGESLARDELFIFTVRLFQSLKVEFDPSIPKPAMKYVLGSVLSPIDHKVIFSERFMSE